MSVLRLSNIHRHFGRAEAVLRGVDKSVPQGQVVGLVGKNGAGKTTLLRIAMGMLKPHQGDVQVFGLNPWTEPVAVKRRIGYVGERQMVAAHLKVRDLIDVHRSLFPSWDEDLERSLMDRLGADPRAQISALSKGEARKVLLLCAIAHRPELLILDEPAGGLDPAARREFLEMAIELLNRDGSTILFSSHHMADLERIAGRVVMLHEGKLLVDTDLDALREHYALAVLDLACVPDADAVLELEDCVRVRKHRGMLHAVFACDPEQAQTHISQELSVPDGQCTRLSLEDLFVELVGNKS